jgi:myo-inositol-1(or 4)-monophosphatase
MDQALPFAVRLARQAGDLLVGYYQSVELQANLKADHSMVTEADLASDRMINDAIREQFPGDWILSEELTPYFREERGQGSKSGWIVDPLDGTTNFGLGLHYWGVLLARVVDGFPQTVVLYFPLLNELYTAEKGGGATLNGNPIRVVPPDPSRPLSFFSCCSRTFRHYQVDIPYKPRILGSTGYSLSSVAHGVAVLAFDARPKVWDIASGWLLVCEAGGVVETLDGSAPFPLRPELDYVQAVFPIIAAANPEVAQRARSKIHPK